MSMLRTTGRRLTARAARRESRFRVAGSACSQVCSRGAGRRRRPTALGECTSPILSTKWRNLTHRGRLLPGFVNSRSSVAVRVSAPAVSCCRLPDCSHRYARPLTIWGSYRGRSAARPDQRGRLAPADAEPDADRRPGDWRRRLVLVRGEALGIRSRHSDAGRRGVTVQLGRSLLIRHSADAPVLRTVRSSASAVAPPPRGRI